MNTHILVKLTEEYDASNQVSYKALRAVDDKEYTHIMELESNMSFFRTFSFAWRNIESNLDAIESIFEKYATSMINTTVVTRATYGNVDNICHIYNYICNFLSSTNMMISLMEKNSTSKDQKEQWTKFKKQLHLENYSYRLCYELRNHSQHAGVPFTTVNAENLNKEGKVKIKLILEKEEVIKSSSCSKKLRQYLNEVDGDIDVYKNMVLYVDVLRKLLKCFLDLNNHFYIPVVEYYKVYSKHLDSNQQECLVLVPSGTHEQDIIKVYERLNLSTCKWLIETFEHKPT